MPGPAPVVAATRVAARAALTELAAGSTVLVACSGGADSLALAAAVAFEAPRVGRSAGAVVVDHGLQEGSDRVAAQVLARCSQLGLRPVEVVRVQVRAAGSGPEDAARAARYAALEQAAQRHGAERVLLGHTLDDQAEQVLLGLARGSGARSLSGMPSTRGVFARPFLGVSRRQTEAACREQGLAFWVDPHNSDPSFARVRARALLVEAERALGPGMTAALARSAQLLRDDADLLDQLAIVSRVGLGSQPVTADALGGIPTALRRRVWRLLAAEAGAGALSASQVAAADALVTAWRGQGPVDLPGGVVVSRREGRVHLRPRPETVGPIAGSDRV